MLNIVLVSLGGLLGSLARYLLSGWVNRYNLIHPFPIGTFTVNILGCFFIGFLGALAIEKQSLNEGWRLFLFTGILGGFTTFSAFSLETFQLIRLSQWPLALLNVASQVICALLMTAVGYWLGKSI